MKISLIIFSVLVTSFVVAQGAPKIEPPHPMRGPYNTLPGGVIDGVALQDEVPIRTKVDYEFVRASDVSWQRRTYSRIDAREKINHDIFFPYDYFDGDEALGSYYNPESSINIDDPTWNKNVSRWSLWTIIMRHILLGDLTVYRVASEFYQDEEDGYSLKYPITKNSSNDYFDSKLYRKNINELIAIGGSGPKLRIPLPVSQDTLEVVKTDQTLQAYINSFKDESKYNKEDYVTLFSLTPEELIEWQKWWDWTEIGAQVRTKKSISMFISSSNIVAYNIKEDWYFDKERSVLDRRIIAIAPIARYTIEDTQNNDPVTRGELVVYDKYGKQWVFDNGFVEYDGQVEEREMFWLYFDELRNVLVNYYVYNDKNDAQWMSFDDLFWKRKFSSTIYKVSDKFDRDIEDYKFGVEALYESERVKESIRNWEQDLWNY
jgi:hypothetical protein